MSSRHHMQIVAQLWGFDVLGIPRQRMVMMVVVIISSLMNNTH